MTDVQTRPDAGDRPERPASDGTAPTRRAVLMGAGALGTTCLLAACGTRGGGEELTYTNDPVPAGSEGTDGGTTAGTPLAAVADVPAGGGVIKGDYVITQPTKGQFKAFSKLCTHQGCDVSKVDGGVITCTCHNSTFSIEDGAPTGGPATRPLAPTAVKVDGDNIVAA